MGSLGGATSPPRRTRFDAGIMKTKLREAAHVSTADVAEAILAATPFDLWQGPAVDPPDEPRED